MARVEFSGIDAEMRIGKWIMETGWMEDAN